jgi:hypothetical protein
MNQILPYSLNNVRSVGNVMQAGRLADGHIRVLMGVLAMLTILAFSAAIGLVLGMRFTVLALGPAALVALLLIIVLGVASSWGLRTTVLVTLASLTVLEIAYFAACLVNGVSFKARQAWMPSYRHYDAAR